MNDGFSHLLSSLQAEVEEYGALLHLFDLQQACIVRHDPAGYLEYLPRLEEQIDRLTQLRLTRDAFTDQLARENGFTDTPALTALAHRCPAARRPLFHALIEEINNLTARIRRRMRQNGELLGRCVETAREIVFAVDGEAAPGTYSAHGKISPAVARNRATPTLA